MSVDWPLVLAFSKAGLNFAGSASWPAAAAFIALRFREPITAIISRATRVSVLGVEAEFPAQLSEVADARSEVLGGDSSQQLTVAPIPPPDEVLSPKDEMVRGMIEKERLTPEQKYAWAIRLAASYGMTADYERFYRLVYGSQVRLLKHLNLVGSMPLSAVRAFYEQHRDKSVTLVGYQFDAWYEFLINSSYVQPVQSDTGPAVQLTPAGRAFLTWMVQQRVIEDKPY